MTCINGTTLQIGQGISLPKDEFEFSFSENLDYLIASRWADNGPDAAYPNFSSFVSLRFCLQEGVLIAENAAGTHIQLDPIPSEEELTQQPGEVLNEYISLGGQFRAGSFQLEQKTVQIGGLGVVDLMDTDPVYVAVHSLPYAGMAMLKNKDTHDLFSVQSNGLFLQKIQIQQMNASFDSPRYDFTRQYSPQTLPNPDYMVMGLLYEPISA